MTKKTPLAQPDPLEQVMATVIQGFQMTTASIQELRDQQASLDRDSSNKPVPRTME